MGRTFVRIQLLVFLFLVSTVAFAAESGSAKQATTEIVSSKDNLESAGKDAEKQVSTQHSIRVRGQELRYTATAGFLHVTEEGTNQAADVFFVAYTKDGAPNAAPRPITFAFNGGPGASSVWLHMGMLGPKRAILPHPGQPSPPPYALVDNEYSWLDLTDLVFIDPVGTGFSREAASKDQEKAKESYYGVKEDMKAVGEFIRLYCVKFHRWGSPKFIAGESYGTVRAVLVANYLLDRFGMSVNGLMLISAVLDFQTLLFQYGNDLPYVMYLPTYALAAAYHHKASFGVGEGADGLAKVAERWALDSYLPALAKGAELTPEERRGLVDELSRLTGLSREFVDREDLRVDSSEFAQELLRTEHRTLGIFDSRFTTLGATENPHSEDPNLISTVVAYVAAFNDYLQRDLKFEDARVYEYLSYGVNRKWNWKTDGQGFLNVADDLATIIRKARDLRVFVASGYYDLATPYAGTQYALRHLGLEPELRGSIKQELYEAGHQMYTDSAVLPKLRGDIEAFIRGALSPRSP
jgi:carboxypeptidase C (cathepsin A)